MRLGFFLREALRALRRSAAPSLAATLTILLTAVVLGVFIPVVEATTGTADEVRSRVVVDVYVKDGAGPAEVTNLRSALEDMPNTAAVEFISKEDALAEEQERNSQAYELLGSNPLPDAFRVTPEDPDGVKALVERLREDPSPAPTAPGTASAEVSVAAPLAAIEEVRNREEETKRILSATGLVKLVTAILSALLVAASIALVANTIRLSIFARRREIEVMRLVGATNWFIRWPFVIEGMLVGLLGGAAAVGLLYLAKITFVDPLSERFALLAAPETLDFGMLVALLLGACIAVAAVGSGLTLRRFLRI
ncbi:MAG TPA: permease-like cell division protein FtsX [Thermoleophilaceae bacterium]|nr:permease-like cell division protein FtsX [Thermoleophilaceae bacterium]